MEELDLAELQTHLDSLRKYNQGNIPDDIRIKLVAEIEFWEVKLKEVTNSLTIPCKIV